MTGTRQTEPDDLPSIQFVGDRGAPAHPLLTRADAVPVDPRLGRRSPTLILLVIPPVAIACLAVVAWWLPLTWSDASQWLSPVLLVIGASATEIAARRCSRDVKRDRPARWAYVADWVALAAFGLATMPPLIGLLTVSRLRIDRLRAVLLVLIILVIAARRMHERRRQALARFDSTVVGTFE